ncbi:MAG TPA: ABC transporter ATP-binding protein [Clostridiales bacterium]|nr:ABC transporter ATP-binding protein [Clostridiales bacterium]
MLEIKNLTKKYGDKVAVDNLSLNVEAGDIYGFIGHNGAGKSTTIKAICGIHSFEEGEIYIDGKSVKTDTIACKKITAYIPDNPDIYSYLTGRQYIKFVADMFRVEKNQRNKLIEKYSTMFEMQGVLDDLISSYSHGMRQKTVIIASLIHSPKLLVMDEPFVGLDPSATFLLKEVMTELCNNGGAIFFSTHVLEVAEKICNKVAIIKGGKLLANGTMKEVKGEGSLEDKFLAIYGTKDLSDFDEDKKLGE